MSRTASRTLLGALTGDREGAAADTLDGPWDDVAVGLDGRLAFLHGDRLLQLAFVTSSTDQAGALRSRGSLSDAWRLLTETVPSPTTQLQRGVFMRPSIRRSLGILIAIQLPVTLSPVAESTWGRTSRVPQSGARTACSLIDPEALKKLTGRQDYLKRGPIPDDPATPGKGRSACGYLGFSFELAAPAESGSFEKSRSFLEKGGAKSEPVSGVGDAAFYWWDPKPGTTRPVGIVLRAGTSTLMVMDMTTPDSIPIVKPQLLAVAKALAPKLR